MTEKRIHRASGIAMIALSVAALITVLSAFRVSFGPLSIHTQPPQADEGLQARLFQLSIVALAPAIVFFLVSANWKRPLQTARPLAISSVAVAIAFGLLYYFEHRP
jgi:hypothetical protein